MDILGLIEEKIEHAEAVMSELTGPDRLPGFRKPTVAEKRRAERLAVKVEAWREVLDGA